MGTTPALELLVHWFDENRRSWQRVVVVVAVLAAAGLFGFRQSMLMLGILAAIIVFPVLCKWPALGFVGLVTVSMISPLALSTGTATAINSTVLFLPVLIGLWGITALTRPDYRLVWSSSFVPLLAFVATAALSFGFGQRPELLFAQDAPLRAQVAGLGIFVMSGIAFFMASQLIRDERWLAWLTWSFVGLVSFFVFRNLSPGLAIATRSLSQPGDNGAMVWIWLVSISFSQGALNNRLRMPWRLFLLGLTVATLYWAWFLNRAWVSGWLPPLVAVFVIVWLSTPRLGLVATLLGGTFLALNMTTVTSLVMAGDNAFGLTTRLAAWRIMWNLITINPVLGLGPANYYWYTPLFSIMGYHVEFNSHNNYVDILAQTGALGLACLFWFVWKLSRLGWRLRAKYSDGFGRAYVLGGLGGLAGMLAAAIFGDWVLPFVYNVGLQGFRASILGWMFLGGLVVLDNVASPPHGRQREG